MGPSYDRPHALAVMEAAARELNDELTIILSGIDQAMRILQEQGRAINREALLLLCDCKRAGVRCSEKAGLLEKGAGKSALPRALRTLRNLVE